MMLQDGSTQILCLTANSGVPLFTRGASKQLPFSVIGSLNGVHMFADGQGAVLTSCQTDCGGRVVWRVFHNSVMLIAVNGGRRGSTGSVAARGHVKGEELFLERLLENVWNCMVLVLGRDELTSARNVERLKKDLRSCFGLIDQLLEDGHRGVMGNLTHCADCLLPPSPAAVQEAVDGFARSVDSEFGCLVVHGRVAAATDNWWRLAPQEVVLLSALMRMLSSSSGSASCDYPVFLPQGSPTVAHRLLRFQLLPGADVCVLCGPAPSLQRAQSDLVRQFWSPLAETLRDCLAVGGERCLPGAVSLRVPPDVLALLVLNREARRSISCVRAGADDGPNLPSKARCWELLGLFYTFAATRYFGQEEAPVPGAPAEEKAHSGSSASGDFVAGFAHQPLQCYLVTEECKCYGMQTEQHQLFLLTPLSVPTFALRNVATQTLSAVTADTGF